MLETKFGNDRLRSFVAEDIKQIFLALATRCTRIPFNYGHSYILKLQARLILGLL